MTEDNDDLREIHRRSHHVVPLHQDQKCRGCGQRLLSDEATVGWCRTCAVVQESGES